MTRRLFLFVLSSLLMWQAMAQSTQHCVVSEYRGKEAKVPLQGVSVTAANAGTVMSDAEGALTLQFRTLKVGDQIQFRRIDKAGYEVMNNEVLDAARVMRQRPEAGSRPEADATGTGVTTLHSTLSSLHIVLAPSKLLRQLRDGYRSVATQRYQKQLEEAEAEAERQKAAGKLLEEEYNERMDALEAEYEDKLSHLESYIDKFARIDLSDLDQDEQQIIDLVQAGDFDQALALYDKQDLGNRLVQSRADRQKLADAREQIAEAERQKAQENLRLRQSIDRQVTLLRMAGGEENLQKAYRILHETFLADTTHVDARRDYAKSLYEQGQTKASLAVLLAGEATATDPFDHGLLLLDAMNSYWNVEQYDDALDCAMQADSLLQPLSESDYRVFTRALPGIISTYLNYNIMMEDLNACRPDVERILQHWSPDTLSYRSLNSYIDVLGMMNQYYTHVANEEKSLWCVTEALHLGEFFYQRWPWGSALHDAYSEAASTYAFAGKPAETLMAARRATELITTRIERYPLLADYPVYAFDLYTVTDALNAIDQYTLCDSIVHMADSLQIFQTLQRQFPGLYDAYYGLVRMNSVLPSLAQGDVAEAERLYQQGISLLEGCADGQDFLPQIQPGTLARLRQAQGQYAEAEQLYRQMIALFAAQYAESQDAYEADSQCRYLLLLAEMQGSLGQKKALRATLKEAERVALFPVAKEKVRKLRKQYL